MIDAGQFDRRITIEVAAPAVDDGMRVKAAGWNKVGARYAALMPLSGAERIAAASDAVFEVQRFRIRRPATFTIAPGQYRLTYKGRVYRITLVQEVGRDQLDLTGSTRSDGAAEDSQA